ncbi:hypothetical protein ECG_02906 [Echinococcus granulosus]|nr:hypothetical protein ECG_02906 [Echinococcus granulosus]
MDIPCVVVEVSCNSSFSIIKNDENVSFAFDYTHNGSGSCSLRSGSFVNMRLQKGYIVHWFWFFTPEPFMEMFGQGFNTVGAEEYLLHGTYALTNLSVFNEFTNETYCANVTALPGQVREPYQDTLIRAGNHYSCMSGWNVTLYGEKYNATLRLGSVKFQAFPDIGAANFSGYAVTCYADHDHNPFGFQGVLVFVCVGVVLVILVYICIRISTLPSPLFQ